MTTPTTTRPHLDVNLEQTVPCSTDDCDTPATWRLTLFHKPTCEACGSEHYCTDCRVVAVTRLSELARRQDVRLVCPCRKPCYWRWGAL